MQERKFNELILTKKLKFLLFRKKYKKMEINYKEANDIPLKDVKPIKMLN